MTGAEILKQWLRGTTCHRDSVKKTILFENESHVVLKHHSHSEWFSYRNNTCGVYAELYLKYDFETGKIQRMGFRGHGELKRWEGRLSLSRILHECHEMGIEFEL